MSQTRLRNESFLGKSRKAYQSVCVAGRFVGEPLLLCRGRLPPRWFTYRPRWGGARRSNIRTDLPADINPKPTKACKTNCPGLLSFSESRPASGLHGTGETTAGTHALFDAERYRTNDSKGNGFE